MTEYYRKPGNKIQADIAYRIGRIAIQYESFTHLPSDHRFETTLNICLLQTLLTNCTELLREMTKKDRALSHFNQQFNSECGLQGLKTAEIVVNTFIATSAITTERVITHVRDALSHPSAVNLSDTYVSTGYTTIPNGSDVISKYEFVSSPDVRKDRPKTYNSEEEAHLALKTSVFPIGAIAQALGENQYQIYHDNKPYVRVFRIQISAEDIKLIVQELSNFLAQPVKAKWNGKVITNVIGSPYLSSSAS